MQQIFTKVKQKFACQTTVKSFLKNIFLEIEKSVYLTNLSINNSSLLLDKPKKTETDRKLEKLLAKSASKLPGQLS